MTEPLHYLTVEELSERVRTRSTSPVEIVDVCLERIHSLQPRLNAFQAGINEFDRENAPRPDAFG